MLPKQTFQTSKGDYHRRLTAWHASGLSTRAAGALATASCDNIDEVTRLGREYFEKLPNCAAITLQELAILAGWPPPRATAAEAISAALLLSIHDPDEAKEAATDALIALRRAGFAVVVSRSVPGGSR